MATVRLGVTHGSTTTPPGFPQTLLACDRKLFDDKYMSWTGDFAANNLFEHPCVAARAGTV